MCFADSTYDAGHIKLSEILAVQQDSLGNLRLR